MLKQSKKKLRTKINKSFKEIKAIENLELARISHEKYLVNSYYNDLQNAIEYYINALKYDPKIAQTYYRLAVLLYEDRQISIDTAISQCLMAIDIEPNNINAQIYAGYFLQVANRLDDAQIYFKKAVNLSPFYSSRPRLIMALNYLKIMNKNNVTIKNLYNFIYNLILGSIFIPFDNASSKMLYKHFQNDIYLFIFNILGYFFEKINLNYIALKIYEIGIKKNKKSNIFYNKAANVLIKLKKPKEAVKNYYKILKNCPYSVVTLINIIEINKKYLKNNIDQTIDCYNKILELTQPDYRIYSELGHLYIKKGDNINACNAFKLALSLNENNAYIHNSLGFSYVNLNLYDDAIFHYKEAIKLNPDNEWTSIICLALASLYFEIKKNIDLAITYFETSLALNPNCEEANIGLGDAYLEKNELDVAMKYYCDALNINPNNEKTYGKCGIALWEHDFVEEAIIAYNKAIEVQKDYDIAYNNLGVIYLDGIGNVQEAIKLFLKAININQKYTLAHFNAARAYEALNNKKEAVKYYKISLKLNKENKELDEDDILNRIHKLFDI